MGFLVFDLGSRAWMRRNGQEKENLGSSKVGGALDSVHHDGHLTIRKHQVRQVGKFSYGLYEYGVLAREARIPG